jgi:Ca2+-binding EF-hand superfamily protein
MLPPSLSLPIADKSNSLSFPEFRAAMKRCGMELSENQLVVLFHRLDVKGTGGIRIDDFLRMIVGSMNRRRRKLVDMAFDILDKDGSGEVGTVG